MKVAQYEVLGDGSHLSALTLNSFPLRDLCDLFVQPVFASSYKPSHQQKQSKPEHHCADKKRHHSEPHYAAQTDAGDSEDR